MSVFPIDLMKKLLPNSDVEYILEATEKYRQKWGEHAATLNLPAEMTAEIVEIATNSYQTGMIVGIGKVRKIRNVEKRIGFVP
jgi:hypothetical protein